MAHHRVICDLELGADLQRQLESLDWCRLLVTTKADRLEILRRMIRTGDNWLDYLAYYGWMLERIATVKNLRITSDLEQRIGDNVQKYFNCSESPVVRLQVIFGGEMLPLHTDITRHASLVIPISNHHGAQTNFYHAMRPVDPALPNPRQCVCVESIEISKPTLIDTDCIHSVVSNIPITKHHPRISVTAKWIKTRFGDLV